MMSHKTDHAACPEGCQVNGVQAEVEERLQHVKVIEKALDWGFDLDPIEEPRIGEKAVNFFRAFRQPSFRERRILSSGRWHLLPLAYCQKILTRLLDQLESQADYDARLPGASPLEMSARKAVDYLYEKRRQKGFSTRIRVPELCAEERQSVLALLAENHCSSSSNSSFVGVVGDPTMDECGGGSNTTASKGASGKEGCAA